MIESSEPISINSLFNTNYKFVIPIYQRPYAWGIDEITQLIDDIIDKGNDNYYIGSLIVKKKNSYYEVIDGQQRLTTLFLLYLFLDKKLIKSLKNLSFELREDTSDKTLEAIYNNDSNIFEDDCSYVDYGIRNGYKIISDYFDNSENNSYIKKINEYLDNTFIFLIDLPEKTDLNHYFEIMNTRGEQLKPTDIVKERIFRMLDDDDELNAANKVWTACENMDRYLQQNFDKDDRYVLFEDKFVELNPNLNANNFLTKISKTFHNKKNNENKINLYEILNNPNKYYEKEVKEEKKDDDIIYKFESIISFSNFLLQVKIIYNKKYLNLDEKTSMTDMLDDKKLLERFSDFKYSQIVDKNKKENNIINAKNFLYCLLKCRQKFDMYIIKRLKEEDKWTLKFYRKSNNYDGYSFLNTFGSAYNKNRLVNFDEDNDDQGYYYCLIKKLEESLRITYTSPKTMEWIEKIFNYVYDVQVADIDSGKLLTIVENYSKSKVIESNIKEINESIKGGKEQYSYNSFSRISFTYLDYILYKYLYKNEDKNNKIVLLLKENYDKSLIKKFVNEISDWEIIYRNSIEHFFPQHIDETTELKKWGYKDLHQFGNLALVSVEGNSKFTNASPKEKIEKKQIIKQSLKLILMGKILEYNYNNNSKYSWAQTDSIKLGDCMIKILCDECTSM